MDRSWREDRCILCSRANGSSVCGCFVKLLEHRRNADAYLRLEVTERGVSGDLVAECCGSLVRKARVYTLKPCENDEVFQGWAELLVLLKDVVVLV